MKLQNPLLIYDGDCAMCNQSVQFILKHIDLQSNLHFIARENFNINEFSIDHIDSLIYFDQKKESIHYYSNAVVQVTKNLKSPYKELGFVLKIIPLFIRDFFYKLIAKHRKSLFKGEKCFLVPTEHKFRILP